MTGSNNVDSSAAVKPATPITIVTGFLGSGKTTLILQLLPQLPRDYRVALLKNEFGDVAIDSRLAADQAVSGVRELLNGCICCNLVGQLGDALTTLRSQIKPNRIIIETSGSAFPATLALEVNRLARETAGAYVLDGVVSVIDVENWAGYEDTSYTAKLQARYTDLIVLNKWEDVPERRLDEVEDRILDLEVDVPRIKSDRGRVPYDILLGLDSGLARSAAFPPTEGDESGEAKHQHSHDHQSEVEVLSIVLTVPKGSTPRPGLDVNALDSLLRSAPRDEIYRIKAVLISSTPPLQEATDPSSSSSSSSSHHQQSSTSAGSKASALDSTPSQAAGKPVKYVLNWAFGRWTVTPLLEAERERQDALASSQSSIDFDCDLNLEATIVTARGEAAKWLRRIKRDRPFRTARVGGDDGDNDNDDDSAKLLVKRLA